MSKVVDSITGAGKVKKGSKKARRELNTIGTTVTTPFGNATLDPSGNISVSGGPGVETAGQFMDLGSLLGGLAGGAVPQGLNLNPQDVMTQAQAAGQDPTGNSFLSGAREALSGLKSFDLTDFIGQRFNQLNELARPQEEQAASGLANRLFSRGRVGGEDTTAGRAFGELSSAQDRAQTQRFLDAEQQGMQTYLSQIQGASQLGQVGSGLNTDSLQRFLGSLQGGIQAQGAGTDLFASLLGGGATAVNTANAAFQPSKDAISTLLAGAGLDFERDAAKAGIYQQSGAAQGKARGNLTGSIFGAFG